MLWCPKPWLSLQPEQHLTTSFRMVSISPNLDLHPFSTEEATCNPRLLLGILLLQFLENMIHIQKRTIWKNQDFNRIPWQILQHQFWRTVWYTDLPRTTMLIQFLDDPNSSLSSYTKWTAKVLPHLLSPLDPIVNESIKNCFVGSLSKIFHPKMMLIYYWWHKLTSFLNRILINFSICPG